MDSMQDFPVILLTGARQVGKSTLMQALSEREWNAAYLTLDARVVLDAALRDPDGFISGTPTPVIIDEVQRAPDLMRAIKSAASKSEKLILFMLVLLDLIRTSGRAKYETVLVSRSIRTEVPPLFELGHPMSKL